VVVSFDNMDHEWTLKFVEHRIADQRILRLIRKWLQAGVSEEGQWSETKVGTPQGAVISPAGKHLPALRIRPVGTSMAGQGGER
jgi:retron-type reverse transcriptase